MSPLMAVTLEKGPDCHLKPEMEVVPLASIDGAVKRRCLSRVDFHSLYSQEVRRIH